MLCPGGSINRARGEVSQDRSSWTAEKISSTQATLQCQYPNATVKVVLVRMGIRSPTNRDTTSKGR